MNDPVPGPIEPGLLTDERTTLLEFLDYFRSVLLRKGDGLDATQLATPLAPTTLTVGRLIRHMAFVEDYWFSEVITATPLEPWVSAPWDQDPDWEITTADGMEFATLRCDYEAACERSRSVMQQIPDLDHRASGGDPERPRTVRWVIVHMIEEYARHCGHADLIAESIDGRVGD
ncbi:MAG: DinB family protein [Ilumatobacter sp.]